MLHACFFSLSTWFVHSQKHIPFAIHYRISDMNKQRRCRLGKKRLSAILCDAGGKETLWEHWIRCLHLDQKSCGIVVHIPPLGASSFSDMGEFREMIHASESHRGSLSPLPQQELTGSPVPPTLQSAVSCKQMWTFSQEVQFQKWRCRKYRPTRKVSQTLMGNHAVFHWP